MYNKNPLRIDMVYRYLRRVSAEIHINGHFHETLIDRKIKIDTLHTIQMVAHLNTFSAKNIEHIYSLGPNDADMRQ